MMYQVGRRVVWAWMRAMATAMPGIDIGSSTISSRSPCPAKRYRTSA